MKKLSLGSGQKGYSDYTTVDINPQANADVTHDLNTFPYPFADNDFDEVLCEHIIEHLDNIPGFLHELYRITKPTGKVIIRTPHFSHINSWGDPTHKWHLATTVFTSWDMEYYCNAKFNTVVTVNFKIIWRRLGIQFFVNNSKAFRRFWEHYLCFIIRGEDITAILQPSKE